tara:strand:- start:52 stop:648 length:597 start_codon:yes stop_codon:yes gene_type:complete
MNRQHRLTDDKKLYQKIIVIEVLQSAAYGDLLKIRDHLRHQKKFLKYENITLDKEKMEVLVAGSSKKDVDKVISWHAKGMREAGHGGYRINFNVSERKFSIEDIVTKEVETKVNETLKENNKQWMKKEQKWSTNKLKMSNSINKFCSKIREKDLKITNLKKKVKLDRIRINEFKTELNKYRVPIHRIIWMRLRELITN